MTFSLHLCSPCVFFVLPPPSLCLFYLPCVFFTQNLFQKRHNLCFFRPHSCRAQLFILYYYSFSIHFHDHLAIILNVTVGFLSLFYLFPFLLGLFLFRPKREQPSLLPCVFFCSSPSYLVLFLQKKGTSPLFPSLY